MSIFFAGHLRNPDGFFHVSYLGKDNILLFPVIL